jgi:uncharacterized RDD family membrane protein YckC
MDKNTRLASGFLRFLSVVVDILVWLLLFLLVLVTVSTSSGLYSLLDSLLYGLIITIALTTFGAPIINSYMISKFGGGFGKLLTGTRIVKEDDGTFLNFKMAFLRNHVGYAVSSLIFGLGFLWLFVDKKRQAWHDMMVQSLVVVRSKKAYLFAILSVFILIMLNVFVANKVYANIMINQEFYKGVIEDIKSEMEKINKNELILPEGDLELEDVGLLH